MSTFPVSARKPTAYTPPSLVGIEAAPSFLLKTANVETKIELSARLVELGIRTYGATEIRNCRLAGLKANVSEADYEQHSNRLIAYWEAMDGHYKAQADVPYKDRVEFAHADDDYVETMELKIADHWPEVRQMSAANYRYNQYSPIVRLSLMLAGWTGLPTPYSKGFEGVTLDQVSTVADELADFEAANKLTVGLAWLQLGNEVAGRVHLTETQRKNSESLSQLPSSPTASENDLAAEPDGISKESETSDPTTTQPDTSQTSTENS
jgi:hypothetical protein